jgi:hypothetical protein
VYFHACCHQIRGVVKSINLNIGVGSEEWVKVSVLRPLRGILRRIFRSFDSRSAVYCANDACIVCACAHTPPMAMLLRCPFVERTS